MGLAGAEKSMTELLKVFDEDRYELHLLALINRGEMFNEVPQSVILHNKCPDSRSVLSMGARLILIKTVLAALFTKIRIFRELPYLFLNIREQIKDGRLQFDKLFWKIISDGTPVLQEKYDIAIAYLEGGAAYYVADHVKADKKAAFIHIDYKKAGYTPLMDHGCYDKMNRIYVVSEDAGKAFREVYPKLTDKMELFYNIINKEAIKKLASQGAGFQDNYDGIRILTIGRLHYQKAYDITIPVIAALKKEGYKVRWYVLGDGAIKGELERMIDKYQVRNDFILLGACLNPYPFLKQCDLYVHVTRFEGKSIAIEEAQVLGKAVVASDCTGNREQIHNGVNGIIVPLDEREIIAGIKKVLDDKTLMSSFGHANESISFDYRKNLNQLYRFMEEHK